MSTLRRIPFSMSQTTRNITRNSSSDLDENIVELFDKVDEPGLKLSGLCHYLSTLNVFQLYKIYTFMKSIHPIDFDKVKMNELKEFIKKKKNKSLLIVDSGHKLKGGGGFKDFVRQHIHDGRKCSLCQQGPNFIRDGTNLGQLHKLHKPLITANEPKHYFHEECLRDYYISFFEVRDDTGCLLCPHCQVSIPKKDLLLSSESLLDPNRIDEWCIPVATQGISIDDVRKITIDVLRENPEMALMRIESNNVEQDPEQIFERHQQQHPQQQQPRRQEQIGQYINRVSIELIKSLCIIVYELIFKIIFYILFFPMIVQQERRRRGGKNKTRKVKKIKKNKK